MKKLLWLSVIIFTLFVQQSCSSNAAEKSEKKDSVVAETAPTKGTVDKLAARSAVQGGERIVAWQYPLFA